MQLTAYTFTILFSLYVAFSNVLKPKHSTDKTYRILALGDSYTKGEGVSPDKSFPKQLLNKLIADSIIKKGELKIIAQTGWTTSNLINALEKEKDTGPYDLVTLLIGVNNQYQNKPIEIFEKEFELLLETAIQKTGGNKNKVIVLAIPDYGYTPFGKEKRESISKKIDLYNSNISNITIKKGVSFAKIIIDISRKGLANPQLLADDGLHPSPIMYNSWVECIYNDVKEKIK